MRVRVVCKPPKVPETVAGGGWPRVLAPLPSLSDCRVFLVLDDGRELEITDKVDGLQIVAYRSDAVRVTLALVDAEFEVDALLEDP